MSDFIKACRGEPVERTPVWFMRQAGRSLPEYRRIRAGIPMLESCRRPELVCEITLQPVRRHGVDAAILFSDIVVPLVAAGVGVDIVAGTGPVVASPIRDLSGVAAVPPLAPEQVSYVDEAVRLLVKELGATPLIGFAGAPFTLASYLIEGGPSRHHEKTKALMYGQPATWHALCERLAGITSTFLGVQIRAGVSAVQLFDSWAGALSEADYRTYVLPHSKRIFESLVAAPSLRAGRSESLVAAPSLRAGRSESIEGVPSIHFGVGTAQLLTAMGDAGPDVVGVDWRTPLDAAAALVGGRPVQGNLDPCVLFAPWEVIEREVRRIVAEGKAAPGHIFNLGHGVMPETDPQVLTRVVELVHSL